MFKNLTSNQLLLIAIAAIMLLLAAFSFYLLQNPSAPLPFFPAPPTVSPTPLSPDLDIISASTTPTPIRRTSYTPQAGFITPGSQPSGTASSVSRTPLPSSTTPNGTPAGTGTANPVNTQSGTQTQPSASTTVSPSATQTLAAGEVGITGRVIQNGTPVPKVVVEFADDVAGRQATTNSGGHYWFISLAPGANFTLSFNQADNLQLTPASNIASLAVLEGTLPSNTPVIDLPDLEVSINQGGMIFELQTPQDGYSSSADAISTAIPIQFNWTLYGPGGSYMVQLGPNGSNEPIWSSSQQAATALMWNGTLDDGSHIVAGTYWWRVSVTKSLGNYTLVVYTQPFDLVFTP